MGYEPIAASMCRPVTGMDDIPIRHDIG